MAKKKKTLLGSDKETAAPPDEPDGVLLRQLQEELAHSRELLRGSREEYEAANEELRAANEELQSINEKYRSTTDELEASEKDLQSMAGELHTLNAELKVKFGGVARAHNDMQNLLAVTEIGVLFLDPELRVQRFTPSVANLFRVTFADQGRRITDFTHRLKYDGFETDVLEVIRNVTPLETEVEGDEGRWFLLRIRPYRTVDGSVEGAVVTFVDVTESKRSAERVMIMNAELDHRVKNILARVLALCEMTSAEDKSSEASGVVAKLCGRIRSMAKTHTLLSRTQWGGADLRAICDAELAPYRSNGNVKISGPSVFLNADAAQAITYVMHELTTNAAKYGALSCGRGRVDVLLSVSDGADGELRIDWREKNGPPVIPPTFVGYGMNVITDLLRHELDAKVDLRFPEAGLECDIVIPLAAIDAGSSARRLQE